MGYRASGWRAVGGVAVLAMCAGAGWVYWWLAGPGSIMKGGARGLVWFAGPPVAWMLGQGVVYGLGQLWRAVTWYEVGREGLVRRTPVGRRVVAWGKVEDFALLPGEFPKPPDRLVLYERGGRRTRVWLEVKDAAEFRRALAGAYRALAEHGVERVRYGGPVPSLKGTRWRLNGGEMLRIYLALGLFLLCVLGGLAMGWNFVDYWRLRGGHETAQGRVEEIEPGDKTVWVTVRFVPGEGGREIRLHRQVMGSFDKSHRVGDWVTVEYLAGNPRVGRIRDWDLDGRIWLLILLVVPVGYAGYVAVRGSVVAWVKPLRRELRWTAKVEADGCHLDLEPRELPAVRAALPAQHDGAVAFWGLTYRRRNEAVLDQASERVMRRAGIECRPGPDRGVLVGREGARRLWARLGHGARVTGEYQVMDVDGVEEVQRIALDGFLGPAQSLMADKRATRFGNFFRDVGPVGSDEIAAAFDRWVDWHVRELYEGVAPGAVCDAAYAKMLNVDATEGETRVLVERTKVGPRVTARRGTEVLAAVAEWEGRAWSTRYGEKVPAALRKGKSKGLPGWTMAFVWPIALVVVLVVAVFVPLIAWSRARDRRKAELVRGELDRGVGSRGRL